jgi:hypothetical protein
MAVTNPMMWHDMYIGQMSEQQAQLIMQTREAKVVPNLKKMIFNFPYELIAQSLEEELSIREIIKRDKLDFQQYIGELRDYQTVGTAFMYLSPRSIIADGVGLGKTAETAALINYLKQKGEMTRFLMAVETSAIAQTVAELTRFTGFRIVGLPSEAVKLKKVISKTDWSTVDGIVIKHSTLRSDPFSKWLALNLDEQGRCKIFNTFFLDESSVIKNQGTKMFDYTKNICHIVERAHLMNATAFETNILDIYNQCDMMNEVLMPKRWRIEKAYCTYQSVSYWTKDKATGKAKINFKRDRSGYKNQAAFKESLKLVYFGRCKKDIGMDLPHIYKVYEVDPSNDMSLALNQGYRYNELLNCPSLIEDLNIPTDREHVPKLDRLCDLVQNEFAEESVMVYCFHIEAQKAIADEMQKIGRKPVILNGACTDAERYAAQQGFNDGTYDVIVTNIKKSLNLYGGNVCIFYSMETNIAKMEQIRGRIDRNVDDSIKTFVMLLYNHTPEYEFFSTVVCQRAKDARDLTIDAETAADFFRQALEEEELAELNKV